MSQHVPRPATSGKERRRHDSFEVELNVRAVLLDDRLEAITDLHGFVRDVSQGGLGVLLPQPVPTGSMMMLVLLDPASPGGVRFQMTSVRQCRRADGEWIYVGVQYHTTPDSVRQKRWYLELIRIGDLAQTLQV